MVRSPTQESLEEASVCLSFSAEPRVTDLFHILVLLFLLCFMLSRASLCVVVPVPRAEARAAELGPQKPGREVCRAK